MLLRIVCARACECAACEEEFTKEYLSSDSRAARVYLRTHADMILNEAGLLQEADIHFQQCLDSLQAVHSDATAGSKRAELEKREPTFCSNNRAVGSRNYELPVASLQRHHRRAGDWSMPERGCRKLGCWCGGR